MSRTVRALHYDAFSSVPNKGNPAGIVVDADHLSVAEMQSIAYQVGFNETAFVLRSGVADLRLRFFTPGREMNLCGHATVAAFSALVSRGLIETDDRGSEMTLETRAGILPIRIALIDDVPIVTMAQAPPQFKPFGGSVGKVAEALGLDAREIDGDLPIVTGTASGVMGAYYVRHIQELDTIQLTIEQGTEIGRDGRVIVDVWRENERICVAITGSAVYVGELDIEMAPGFLVW